ncbi:MAG: hypothetical protein MUF10_00750 [Thermoanaerobaculaceae bacterium]|nr:hypothetical protein [Thermoanaerobaculaceae bacterium]
MVLMLGGLLGPFPVWAAGSIAQPGAFHYYYVPSVAHLGGTSGTTWRTDLSAVNTSTTEQVDLTFTYYDVSNSVGIGAVATIPPGGTTQWPDVLVSLFQRSPTASAKGIVHITATGKLALSSRTYNQASAVATFGQYYPAIDDNFGVPYGTRGFLPGIRQNAAFRTNIGLVNLNDKAGTVRISIVDETGAVRGTPKLVEVQPYRWLQVDRIFDVVGAGNLDTAYAVIEVTTTYSKFWAYASVIDNLTGDPMTIPVLLP